MFPSILFYIIHLYVYLPIIFETNLLRSVGGIHRAVIGWMAGQVAPYMSR